MKSLAFQLSGEHMTHNCIFNCVQAHLCHICINVLVQNDKAIIYIQGKAFLVCRQNDFQNIGSKKVSVGWWQQTTFMFVVGH